MRKTQRIRSDTSKIIRIYRDKVDFKFKIGGVTYKNNTGRIKVSEEGYLSFLIKEEGKWKPKKGVLISLKLSKEYVGYTKVNA